MKMLFVLPCLLFFTETFAQTEFLDHKNTWTESFSCVGSDWVETMRYTIDSFPILFEDREYYEVLKSPTPTGDNFLGTGKYISRQDSNIVYSYNGFTAKVEYNYNLNEGDTISIQNEFECIVVVGDIDTISLENGDLRKKWIFYESGYDYHPEYESGYFHWLEGIGSQWGIFGNSHLCQIDGCGNYLLCVNYENILIYQAPHFLDTCWVTITSTNDPDLNKIKIYPNPVHELLEISDPELQFQSIYLISVTGDILSVHNEKQISTNHLTPGSYILRLYLRNGKSEYRKIIKL